MKLPSSLTTKIFGISGALGIIIGVIERILDGDPLTNPDWNIAIPAFIASVGLIFARTNNVSSEEVGIKPTPIELATSPLARRTPTQPNP